MSVWWLMFWRASVGSFLLGVLTGTIWGLMVAVAGGGRDLSALGGSLSGLAVALVWFVFVVRMALKKNYRGFRLEVVPT